MSEKKTVPEIRFKGYTDAWEQRKLGECFSERIESDPTGELISVTIGSGIKKFSELGRHDSSNDDKSKYKKVVVGDIAYNSMRMWQGASGYSPYNGIVSPAYTVITPFSRIDSRFFAYMFKRKDMIHTFQIKSQGITSDNWNLKFPALSEISVMVPTSIEEQGTIAAYFSKLDSLITLHQRKYDKLKNVKKSMLEKMFPKEGIKYPEIRFKGFTDAWEQRKVSDICSISTGKSNTQDKNDDGKYPFYVRSPIIERSNRYLYDEEAVLTVGDGVGTGKVFHYVNGKYDLHQRVYRLFNFSGDIDAKFFYHWFSESFYERVMSMTAKTSVDSVRLEMIADMEMNAPSYDEQKKISDYLSNLDNLITLHQRKLAKLKNIKKSMLEKMFV